MTTPVSRKRGADALALEPDEQGAAKRHRTEGGSGTTAEKTGALFTDSFANGIAVGEKSIPVNVQTSHHVPRPVLQFDPRTLGMLTGPLFDTPPSDPGPLVDLQNATQVAPVSTSAEKAHDVAQSLLSPRDTSAQMDESTALVSALTPAAQSDEPDHEELGLDQLLKEQFQDAVASFEKCVAAANSDKKSATALNQLGMAQLGKLGLALYQDAYEFGGFQGLQHLDYETAIETFKKALASRYDFDGSFRFRVQFNLAVAYFCRNDEGDDQLAVDLLMEGLKDVDENDVTLIMSVEDRFFCAKMCWFLGTLLEDQQQAREYYNLGLACQMQQLGEVRQTHGDPYQGNLFALIHLCRGISFKKEKIPQLAKKALQQVIALENELSNQSIPAKAYCELGLLNEMTGGEVDQSIKYYDHGLTCGFNDPHLEATLEYNRARLFTDVKRDFSLAIQVCERALKLDTQDVPLLGDLYFLLIRNYAIRRQGNDLQSAIDHGQMALELNLENSMLIKFLVALGEINGLVGDYNRAGEHFYEVAGVEGLEAHARVEYLVKSAAFFAKADEYEQALESAKKANELNVDKLKKIQLHLFLGQTYNVLADKTEDQGKRDELLDAGKKILEEGLKLKETLEKEQTEKQGS